MEIMDSITIDGKLRNFEQDSKVDLVECRKFQLKRWVACSDMIKLIQNLKESNHWGITDKDYENILQNLLFEGDTICNRQLGKVKNVENN